MPRWSFIATVISVLSCKTCRSGLTSKDGRKCWFSIVAVWVFSGVADSTVLSVWMGPNGVVGPAHPTAKRAKTGKNKEAENPENMKVYRSFQILVKVIILKIKNLTRLSNIR